MLTTPAAVGGDWRLRSVGMTNTGLVRAQNEDSFVNRPAARLWAVADGMGGHNRGEVASAWVKEALEAIEPPPELEAHARLVRARLEAVHERLLREMSAGTCGSTVAALIVAGDRIACLWAGDSRVYRYRRGGLERLTRDHSLVEELIAIGALKPEAARHHPLANRITRAVGVGNMVELDQVEDRLAPGDRYLISTDGVHGVLAPGVLANLVALPDLTQAADALTKAVLAAGAPDNLTLVLVAAEHDMSGTILRAPGRD